MTARMIQAAALACALTTLPACHSDQDEVELGEPFQLAAGESRRVEQYTVRFDGVDMDSRCPGGPVVCFWQGSIELTVTVRSGGTEASYGLGTYFNKPTVEIAPGRVLRLLSVEPGPGWSTDRTPPEAYRVTLRVMPQA